MGTLVKAEREDQQNKLENTDCEIGGLQQMLLIWKAQVSMLGRGSDSSLTTPRLHPKEQRPFFGDPGLKKASVAPCAQNDKLHLSAAPTLRP